MVSRAWRLLPVFWLTGALAIGVAVYLRSSVPVTPHVIVSDVAILGYASLRGYSSSLPAAWSLDLEIQFYLLAPLLLTALYRLKQRGI
jgi:peptidoglycan/LPS O-acetylase OafA/YrhL